MTPTEFKTAIIRILEIENADEEPSVLEMFKITAYNKVYPKHMFQVKLLSALLSLKLDNLQLSYDDMCVTLIEYLNIQLTRLVKHDEDLEPFIEKFIRQAMHVISEAIIKYRRHILDIKSSDDFL